MMGRGVLNALWQRSKTGLPRFALLSTKRMVRDWVRAVGTHLYSLAIPGVGNPALSPRQL